MMPLRDAINSIGEARHPQRNVFMNFFLKFTSRAPAFVDKVLKDYLI